MLHRKLDGFKRHFYSLLIAHCALLPFAVSSQAANHYVRAGASGSGADWATAFAALPATLVRGDVYYVAAGTYGAYTFDDPVSGTQIITVKKATASDHGTETGWVASYGTGAATFAAISFNPTKYVTLDGLTVSGQLSAHPYPSSSDLSTLAFLNFYNITSKSLFIGGQDILVRGGNFGNFDPCLAGNPEDIVMLWDNHSNQASSRITLDGVTIHDSTDHGNLCAGLPGAGIHADCMQILGGHFLTIKNSFFYNCPTSGIIAQGFRDTLDNVVIENNWFQAVQSPGATINFGGGDGKIGGANRISYNTILGGSSMSLAVASGGSLTIHGNIMTVGSCGNGTYSNNLFVGGATCGSNTRTGTPSFVNSPSPGFQNGNVPNYHLTAADTAAKDRGDAASYPATDIDGQTRYAGSAPDLGADELGGGTTPPPPPSGSACDINQDSSTNVNDVQLCANQSIGVTSCSTGDINKDSQCNVVDVQRVVNAALGGACVSP